MAKKKRKKKKAPPRDLACFRSGAFMCKAEHYIEQAREAAKKNENVEAARFIGLAARQGIAAGRIMLKTLPEAKQATLKERIERFREQAETAFHTTRELVVPRTLEVLEDLDDVRDELLKDVSVRCGLRTTR